MTHNSTVLEDACSGELQPSNHSHPPDPYVAAVLNLSAPTDFVLGDGTRGHGFHNAPLHPGWDYSALLRLARRSPQVPVPGALVGGAGKRPPCPQPWLGPWVALSGSPLLRCGWWCGTALSSPSCALQQAETFTCVCYSFSMGEWFLCPIPVPKLFLYPSLSQTKHLQGEELGSAGALLGAEESSVSQKCIYLLQPLPSSIFLDVLCILRLSVGTQAFVPLAFWAGVHSWQLDPLKLPCHHLSSHPSPNTALVHVQPQKH